MRVFYDDIVLWHPPVLFPSHQIEIPTVTDADEGGQEGQEYGSEESEAIFLADGES